MIIRAEAKRAELALYLVVKREQIDTKCPSDCTNGQILVQDFALNADYEVSAGRTFVVMLTTCDLPLALINIDRQSVH